MCHAALLCVFMSLAFPQDVAFRTPEQVLVSLSITGPGAHECLVNPAKLNCHAQPLVGLQVVIKPVSINQCLKKVDVSNRLKRKLERSIF